MFVATKLEAFKNRGDGDYRASHDLEDIIAVVDGRVELVHEMEHAPHEVLRFVRSETGRLLDDPDFLDALPGHVIDSGRVSIVVERMRTY